MVVDPAGNHVRVLLMEGDIGGLAVGIHRGVETVVIGCEGLVSPKHVLSPQVRVGAAFVHSSVRLKAFLNEQLVLFEHQFGFFRVGAFIENFIEVSSDTVLLLVESVKVGATDGEHVLRQ